MKSNILIFVTILLISANLFAANMKFDKDKVILSSNNITMFEVVKTYFKHLNKNIIIHESMKDSRLEILGKKELSLNDFETFFTSVLFAEAALIVPGDDVYKLVPARNARYETFKMFTDITKVPTNYQFVRYTRVINHMDTKALTRSLRPFLSRYSRIIDVRDTGSIVIADTGKNIHRLMKLVDILDTKEHASSFREWKKQLKEINSTGIINKKSLFSTLSEHNVLFIALFSILFAMIGFSLRGFVIRRIEGGY